MYSATESGSSSWWKFFSPPPPPPQARADRLKIFTLYRKEWLSVAEWIGIGLKGLTVNKQTMILPRKEKKLCNVVRPRPLSGTPGPGNFYVLTPRHWSCNWMKHMAVFSSYFNSWCESYCILLCSFRNTYCSPFLLLPLRSKSLLNSSVLADTEINSVLSIFTEPQWFLCHITRQE
jgi:hypothetical protein